MATPRVTVYQSAIQEAFWPGGTVYENMRRISFENIAHAQRRAPVRTGALQAGMYRVITPFGKYQTRYTIGTTADYAIYTIEGTVGPIYPSTSKVLWVRPSPHSWYRRRTARISVEGQVGHNWLEQSVQDTFYDNALI